MTQTLHPHGDTAPSADHWAGTGQSAATDAATAGSQAAGAAVAGRDASLLLVFASIAYELPALLDAVRAHAAPDTVIAGCSTLGQFGAEGFSDPGVVVLAVGPGYEVRARVARAASEDRRGAGTVAAAAAQDLQRGHKLLMLLCDGVAGNQHEIVRGAYAVVGVGVPLVGGCAADELAYERTYQFHGDADGVEILSDAVVGLALGADHRFFGLGIEHGWMRVGEPMEVTTSGEGRVIELDGRPALEVYLERSGLDPALTDDPAAFGQAAFAWPLGLSSRGREDIRVITGKDAEGALTCLADVPQGAIAWLMQVTPEQLIEGGARSCRTALDGLGATEPRALLVFDCGARRALLGPDGVANEVAGIAGAAGQVPVVGFYTYGEIARISGARGMHHLTCVALALG